MKYMDEFLKFVYYLRKIDVEDKYTEMLIEKYVRPKLLLDIVMANYWNKE